MKKIISLLLCAVMLTSLLASCSGSTETEAPAGMKKASNDAAGYTLFIPTAWEANETTAITTVSPGVDTKTNVTVARISKSTDMTDAQTYFNSYTAELKEHMPDYENVGEPTDVMLDSTPATRFTYKGTLSGVSRKYAMVVCIKGNYAYLMTFTSTNEEYDTYFDDFKSMYENIKLG